MESRGEEKCGGDLVPGRLQGIVGRENDQKELSKSGNAWQSTQIREIFGKCVPRFETFEIIAAVVGYIAYEWRICFCCEVAIPKVLIDTSASQTICC
jgi:hypothetical protein